VLHKEIPFLRIGLPLCLGIISGLYFQPGIFFYILITFFIFSGLVISLFFNKQLTNYVFGPVISVALFTCGLVLYTKEKSNISVLQSQQSVFTTILTDYPQEKENSLMLTVQLKQRIMKEGNFPLKGSMVLYHKKDIRSRSLLPGDILTIRCSPIEIVNKGNPYEFDYKFYMETKGIRYYAFTDSLDILSHVTPDHRNLVYKSLINREKIIQMYKERGITGERLALVAAITLGQKNLLDPEQKQIFIKAGIMHIMAVSGLHAVILSVFIFNLLFFLKGKFNIVRIIFTILILWEFAFITGLTPSVLRAALMFSFLQTGNIMKRRVNGVNSVLASAFVLILIKPSVIFDAGFLLSYAAVIFIIGFYQDLYLKFRFRYWLTDKIWQSAVVTLVAQAGTLPLTIMLFNRFPVYFILTNIIIVPISSLLIIVGCLVPLTFPVHIVSQTLASVLNFLTWLTEFLTELASSLPYSSIDRIGMTTIECIFLTGVISLFLYFFLKNQSISFKYPVICMLIFVTTGTVNEIINRKSNELIVYNTSGYSTIGIKTGHILNLYTSRDDLPPEVVRHCATIGLKLIVNKSGDSPRFFKAGNHRISLTNSLKSFYINDRNTDFVVLTGSKPNIEKGFNLSQMFCKLIITSEAGTGFHLTDQINSEGKKVIWFVRQSGCFRQRL
jgi:competence protein ComEC